MFPIIRMRRKLLRSWIVELINWDKWFRKRRILIIQWSSCCFHNFEKLICQLINKETSRWNSLWLIIVIVMIIIMKSRKNTSDWYFEIIWKDWVISSIWEICCFSNSEKFFVILEVWVKISVLWFLTWQVLISSILLFRSK